MKWNNDELSVFLGENNVIIIRINKKIKQMTVSASKECVGKIKEAMKLNNQPKVLFFYMPNIYVPKDVIRCYADVVFGEVGMAVFCESFTAWLMGNIGVKIRRRFTGSNTVTGAPIEAFKSEEEAMKWSLDRLKEAL